PTFSSSSWSSCVDPWPSKEKKDVKWPETWTGASGVIVPENTRTTLTRPTYWSLEVFTISATSWPRGSPVIGSATAPAGVNTSGEACSSGEGKPSTARSSSSGHPTPDTEQTGTTGWKL